MAAIFTREELMSLKKESLRRLALYYEIPPVKLTKVELVDALMKVLIDEKPNKYGMSLPTMSERVRRIKESLENG